MPGLVNTRRRRLLPAAASGYSQVHAGPGEPDVLRDDLGGDPVALSPGRGQVLLRMLHLTDLHIMDAGSPARSDWVEARADDRKWHPLLHMARPHDLLGNWGSVQFSRAIREAGADAADMAIFTGDNIDNAQRNELDAFVALGNGGSFGFPYEGPQRSWWAEDVRSGDPLHRTHDGLWPFWLPEGGAADRFRVRFGFPGPRGRHASPGIRCGTEGEEGCSGSPDPPE